MSLGLRGVTYALRRLLKDRALTFGGLVTLALGIGVHCAVFSALNTILIRPLPYADPGRLALLLERSQEGHTVPVSVRNFRAWKQQNDVFEAMAHIPGWVGPALVLSGADQAERIQAVGVSATLFEVLGVGASLGRTFSQDEGRGGNDRVVVLSHHAWVTRFGGDPKIVGRDIVLSGKNYTVVGVMPADFEFPALQSAASPALAELWTPIDSQPSNPDERGLVYARLKAGVSFERAQAEMDLIAQRLKDVYPDDTGSGGIVVLRLSDWSIRMTNLRPVLLAMLGVVTFVLLIAASNVVGMFLAKQHAREGELAVLRALGAEPKHIVGQMLTESCLLATVGGGLGTIFAVVLLQLIRNLLPPNIPRADQIVVDTGVVVFSLVVSLAVGMLVGLIPAVWALKREPQTALSSGPKGHTGRGAVHSHRSGSLLVTLQIAMAFTLVTGAGLTWKGLLRLSSADLGLDPRHVLTVQMELPAGSYSNTDRIRNLQDTVQSRIESLPGVEAIGVISRLPLHSRRFNSGRRFTLPERSGGERASGSLFEVVTPNAFRALGVPVLMGREFSTHDVAGTAAVVMVNERLAKREWPDQNPIGARINIQWGPSEVSATVVGVVGNVKQRSVHEDFLPMLYMPVAQIPDGPAAEPSYYEVIKASSFVIRTTVDPETLIPAVRNVIRTVDGGLPVEVVPMESIVNDSLAPQHFTTALIGVFALVGLVLCSFGVYGVVSYATRQRTQELGIRMAMGATAADLVRMILGQGLRRVILGVAFGLVASLSLGGILSSQLYGVRPTDPPTYFIASVLLVVVATIACYIPARRATRVDPAVVLRHE